MVKAWSVMVLAIDIEACFAVFAHHRDVGCGVILHASLSFYGRRCVAHFGRIAHRFLGNDVDGASDGRRTI